MGLGESIRNGHEKYRRFFAKLFKTQRLMGKEQKYEEKQ